MIDDERKVRDGEDAIARHARRVRYPKTLVYVNHNAMTPNVASRPWYRPSLTVQIMIGLIVGILIGWLRPDWGNSLFFLRDVFIGSGIAWLAFSTMRRRPENADESPAPSTTAEY